MKNNKEKKVRDAKFSSELVKLSSKISHIKEQIIKIGDKYFKVKELG